jgi:hypothetical protein
MMPTERKHRCGGVLMAREVQVVIDDSTGMSLSFRVDGFVCDKCHEQLIDRETALHLQPSQTPTVIWHAGSVVASTWLNSMRFDPLTAGTPKQAVV